MRIDVVRLHVRTVPWRPGGVRVSVGMESRLAVVGRQRRVRQPSRVLPQLLIQLPQLLLLLFGQLVGIFLDSCLVLGALI